MNNTERSDWIENDESLYSWWQYTLLTKRQFIKEHREKIDAIINKVLGK